MNKKNALLVLLLLSLLVAVSSPLILRAVVQWQTKAQIYSIQDAPNRPVAIVYGAAIFRGDRLSTVLRDRMDTAIALFDAGKVDHLLVSGYRQDDGYDEPGAMAEYAIQNGVPGERIIADDLGTRTYDTCYRALNKFDVSSAILVTQAFHLPRALFTCNQMGIDSIGVAADKRPYRAASWYNIREVAATMVALFDVITQNPPALGTTTSLQ
jgi:SanA protein